MRNLFFILFLSLAFFSCKTEEREVVDVSHINVDFSLERFDEEFYTSTKENLADLKKKYPLFFPVQTADSTWISKIKEEQELFIETQKLYPDISFLKNALEDLFKRVTYYNPNFKSPKVITLLNSVDYENRVIYTGELLLISLDVYLGTNHQFYADYPSYIKQNFTKDHIIVDVANAIITKSKSLATNRSFVSKMVEQGKLLYLLDTYLPLSEDYQKIGYSEVKFQWSIENEEQIWKYFVENKLLFSTDTKLNQRFLDLAPFSKFYRSEDNQSPGRIGAWIGWQIVKAFMENNNVPLQKLMHTSSEDIYKQSKYKPNR
jgi:gliding motility-associated lipoprotein GldB